MSHYWPWFVAGGVIIAALAGYAGYLLWRLREQRRALEDAQRAQSAGGMVAPAAEVEPAQHRLGAEESIQVLARCYLDGQVGGSEAALRIAVLLDQPVVDAELREQGRVFTVVAEVLADVPTHQAWKSLSREERDQHRDTMTRLEAEHRDAMEQAALRLSGQG